MRYWVGAILFLCGAWFVWSGLQRRRQVMAAKAAAADGSGAPLPVLSPGMAIIGDVVPPLVCIVLAIVGAKVTFAYFVVDAGRFFSLFDLGGLLFLMASYGLWMILRAKHRPFAEPTSFNLKS